MTTIVLNTKISEVKNKITNTSSLVTTTILNTKLGEIENKIPDNSKYITNQELNKLTAENFVARLKQSSLVNKSNFEDLINELPQIKGNI